MKQKPLTNKSGRVRELTREDIRGMRPAKDVLPPDLFENLPKRKVGQRGKQKTPTKVQLTNRYSPEVVEYFKETGEGWQTRMDDVLKKWIAKHPNPSTANAPKKRSRTKLTGIKKKQATNKLKRTS